MKKLMIGLLCVVWASVMTGCCLLRPRVYQIPPTIDRSVNVYQDGNCNVQQVQVIEPEFVARDGSVRSSSYEEVNLGGNQYGGAYYGGSYMYYSSGGHSGGYSGWNSWNGPVRTPNAPGCGRNTQGCRH